MTTVEVLDVLEGFHGEQTVAWPTGPYAFLVWWHCGYPASDATCARGWEALKAVGSSPQEILAAGASRLTDALRAGGMVPELRAQRLLQIAARVQDEFGGDLMAGLTGPVEGVRRLLKTFPNIADPGADRMLLFARLSAVAAVPSNCPQVLVRIQLGLERENYGVTYKEAQRLIEAEVQAGFEARMRAYLLLKRHGQELCKRTKPLCAKCPLSGECRYAAGANRGRNRP